MFITIKEKRINFDNVVHYSIRTIERRKLNGEETGIMEYKLWVETINEDEEYGGVYFEYDTLVEAKAVIKQLDEILKVVKL